MPASSEFEVKESLLVKQRDREKANPQAEHPLPSGIYFFYGGSSNQGIGHSVKGRNIQDLSGGRGGRAGDFWEELHWPFCVLIRSLFHHGSSGCVV